jgi:hypothetical protein
MSKIPTHVEITCPFITGPQAATLKASIVRWAVLLEASESNTVHVPVVEPGPKDDGSVVLTMRSVTRLKNLRTERMLISAGGRVLSSTV